MAKKKKTPPKTWMLPTPTQRTAKAAVPERIKADLDARATKLVESVLKPRYVKPPPKEERFNYITEVWTKWIGSTLYFGADLRLPWPHGDLSLVRDEIRPYGTQRRRQICALLHAAHRQVVQAGSQRHGGRVPGSNRERVAFPNGLKGA